MRNVSSDRLLFLDDDDDDGGGGGASAPDRAETPKANTLAAALFLLGILAALGSALYFLAAWHALRMH